MNVPNVDILGNGIYRYYLVYDYDEFYRYDNDMVIYINE